MIHLGKMEYAEKRDNGSGAADVITETLCGEIFRNNPQPSSAKPWEVTGFRYDAENNLGGKHCQKCLAKLNG